MDWICRWRHQFRNFRTPKQNSMCTKSGLEKKVYQWKFQHNSGADSFREQPRISSKSPGCSPSRSSITPSNGSKASWRSSKYRSSRMKLVEKTEKNCELVVFTAALLIYFCQNFESIFCLRNFII
jgi:hypothetical protein